MTSKLKTFLFSSTSKDTFVSLLGNLVLVVTGMIFTVYAARSLEPSDFGVFSAILALATLIASLGDLGISSALINFLPKFKSDRHQIISLAFWIQALISLVLSLIVLALIPLRFKILPGATSLHFLLLDLIVVSYIFSGFAKSILRAEKRFLYVSLLQVLDSCSKLGLVMFVFYFSKLSINWILFSVISSSFLAALFGIFHEFRTIKPIFPKHYFSQVFHFSKWLAVMTLFSVTISRIDIILLNALGNGYQAGIFAAASRIGMLFAVLVSTLGGVIAPRFSSFHHSDQVRLYIKKVGLMVSVIAIAMLASMLFSPLIINFVFGDKYQASIPIFKYLTLAMIPFLFSTVTVTPLIYFFNKPQVVTFTTIIQVLIIIITDVLLIPRIGPYAPVVALAISNSFVLLFTGIYLAKIFRSK